MTISTLDGALAGMKEPVFFYRALTGTMVAGRPTTLFYANGGAAGSCIPGAATAPSPGINGAVLSSGVSTTVGYAGQLPFNNFPTSGNRYLARFAGTATVGGVLILADRIWHNSGINVSSSASQVISTPTWPARDADGATLGNGVLVGLEISATVGAGTPQINLNYTDSDGNTGNSGREVISTVASSIQGTFYPIGLAAGDKGVRSIQAITLSATMTSGSVSLVAYRPIAALELPGNNLPGAMDCITSGFPRMYAGTVPFLIFVPYTTTTSNVAGQIVYTDG
jgi:hypothetical protein